MTWLLAALLAAFALLPLAWAVWRAPRALDRASADRALYRAKETGRRRVCFAENEKFEEIGAPEKS